ncbi:zinc finger protein 276-like [Salvelinus namaycush]|uniref:Zinc finger protein 276 n=1 Tax=Salvelinus namaycush TaxID=8040 RepID=A0A8U1EMN1_SALNM|nr:zinc finger protein 276-like [Salvelinus namaycush]
MKKRGRRARLPDVAEGQRSQTQSVAGVKKPAGRRERPKNAVKTTPPSVACDGGFEDVGPSDRSARLQLSTTVSVVEMEGEEHPENRSKKSGMGRLSTAFCRLCHGKFSPRRLRHAFDKWPGELEGVPDQTEPAQSPLLFYTDFQRLVGVPLNRDPRLSQFVCKNCHTKFYKCHTILLTFLQRVNLLPSVNVHTRDRKSSECSQSTVRPSSLSLPLPAFSIPSDPKCLHSLVSWAHHHAEDCRSCPALKEVLEGQCWGSVRAVWACVDGHSYMMDTQTRANPGHTGCDPLLEAEEQPRGNRNPVNTTMPQASPAATPLTQRSINTDATTTSADEFFFAKETPSPAPAPLMDRTGDIDLYDRNMSSEDELEDKRKSGSSDELFEPYPEKKVASPKKRTRRKEAKTPKEPKVRKKPGPKPGWKKTIKSEREELPNIYKCPYQGCSAVYRGADGMKKHIKEHHEEIRERPCPHPGCNKVFMIDRYLQRHVKLIHTEVRNYICDQCGQTFKQRKHLSVHQMRHSGVKPLQCEVCGFQCRQRASLKYHMTKHKAEADLEFACKLCGKRFEKAHNLNVHMSMVHPLTLAAAGGNIDSPSNPAITNIETITETGELNPYTS